MDAIPFLTLASSVANLVVNLDIYEATKEILWHNRAQHWYAQQSSIYHQQVLGYLHVIALTCLKGANPVHHMTDHSKDIKKLEESLWKDLSEPYTDMHLAHMANKIIVIQYLKGMTHMPMVHDEHTEQKSGGIY